MIIVTWILRVLAASLFLFLGYIKLSGDAYIIEQWSKSGIGEFVRSAYYLQYHIGSLEIVGAVAVLIPRTTRWGVVLLIFTELLVGYEIANMSHTSVWSNWSPVGLFIVLLGPLFFLSGRTQRSTSSDIA
jgi:uncharacterized membrane protein YphA (DoxX/SURF4 family)